MATRKTKQKLPARKGASNHGAPPVAKNQSKALVTPSRAINSKTTLHLYTRAGGRCEFDGCNRYLMEHHATEAVGNFAAQAHIYAFNQAGPRGDAHGRPASINAIGNLMLLCNECHHLVDTVSPADYPVKVLQKFKKDHEDRVYGLTGIGKDRGVVPLVIKGRIGDRALEISDEEMQSAVAPNYLRIRDRIEIDLASITDTPTDAYRRLAMATIDAKLDALDRLPAGPGGVRRIAVFGISSIPILAYVGSRLSDKRHTDVFRRHRTRSPAWNWDEGRGNCEFGTTRVASGAGDVALLINVSGTNDAAIFEGVLRDPTVYQLALVSSAPALDALSTLGDLERFIDEYHRATALIRAEHPEAKVLHVLAAVPAPVAIAMGRSRLPKVDPRLLIYDLDRRDGGLTEPLAIDG